MPRSDSPAIRIRRLRHLPDTPPGSRLLLVLLSLILIVQLQSDTDRQDLLEGRHGPAGLRKVARAVALIRERAIDPPSESELYRAALRGIIEAVEDPYAAYFPPEASESGSDPVEGFGRGAIGAVVGLEKGGGLRILGVLPGSPADRAGVRPGAVIVSVSGVPLSGRDLQTALQLLRGPVGEAVSFQVRSGPEETPRAVTVTREALPGTEPVEVRMLPGEAGLGHLRLLSFPPALRKRVRNAVNSLLASGMRGLILDLRDNGGGLLEEGMATADLFLSKGVVTIIEGREPYPSRAFSRRIQTASPESLGDFPLVILVNGGTASAAEVLAAGLRENGRAVLIGSHTFGKGRIQEAISLGRKAGAVRVTVGRYLTPSGTDIQDAGIRPDVTVELSEEERTALYQAQAEAWYNNGRVPEDAPEDRQLERAAGLLREALRRGVSPAELVPDPPDESAEASDESGGTGDERRRTDIEGRRMDFEEPRTDADTAREGAE